MEKEITIKISDLEDLFQIAADEIAMKHFPASVRMSVRKLNSDVVQRVKKHLTGEEPFEDRLIRCAKASRIIAGAVAAALYDDEQR